MRWLLCGLRMGFAVWQQATRRAVPRWIRKIRILERGFPIHDPGWIRAMAAGPPV